MNAESAVTPAVKDKPTLISWNLTSGCNLACSHCYLAAAKVGKAELTTAEGLELIDQMAELGTEMLILTGGEPLLRRDVYELAGHASQKAIAVVLGSNGVLINERVAGRLADSGVVSVGLSLDSINPAEHDSFRGFGGAWAKTVSAIDTCQASGIGVLLQTTVASWNWEQLPRLLEFGFSKGVQGVMVYFLVCTGRGEELTDITPEQYEQTLDYLVDAQSRYPGMMVRSRCAPHIVRIAAEKGSPLLGSAGCIAATSYCRITPEGRVTPCPYLPLEAGSVREQSLRQIWETSSLLKALRQPRLTGRCGECEYRGVCVGCRARAFATSADYLGEDPWCRHVPQRKPLSADVEVDWTPEALTRLQRVPGFVRSRVTHAIEQRARSQGDGLVTVELIRAMMAQMGRMPFRGRPEQTTAPKDVGDP